MQHADPIDQAVQQSEMILQKQLAYRKPVSKIQPNGRCHNPRCELDLDNENQLFCDDICAQEHYLSIL